MRSLVSSHDDSDCGREQTGPLASVVVGTAPSTRQSLSIRELRALRLRAAADRSEDRAVPPVGGRRGQVTGRISSWVTDLGAGGEEEERE